MSRHRQEPPTAVDVITRLLRGFSDRHGFPRYSPAQARALAARMLARRRALSDEEIYGRLHDRL